MNVWVFACGRDPSAPSGGGGGGFGGFGGFGGSGGSLGSANGNLRGLAESQLMTLLTIPIVIVIVCAETGRTRLDGLKTARRVKRQAIHPVGFGARRPGSRFAVIQVVAFQDGNALTGSGGARTRGEHKHRHSRGR